jgi:hypothetical protein
MKNLYPNSNHRTLWQCLKCPHEVFISESDNIIRRISIFVKKDGKEYCLHWYVDTEDRDTIFTKKFDISVVNNVGEVIFSSDTVPENLTPATAYQKLLTYLIFL